MTGTASVINRRSSKMTNKALTDKQKLFLFHILMNGPIPARTYQDRLNIAEALNCSDRTVFRVLAGVRENGTVHVDGSRNYNLTNGPQLHGRVLDRTVIEVLKTGPNSLHPEMVAGAEKEFDSNTFQGVNGISACP